MVNDSQETYLKLKELSNKISDKRLKEAEENIRSGLVGQVSFEIGMLPIDKPNVTQAYQATLDMFAFVPTNVGKLAFLMVPDRCNTCFPVRTGNYRDAHIFDCITLEGQKVMVRRQVLLEEVIMVDYLGQYEHFIILMGK